MSGLQVAVRAYTRSEEWSWAFEPHGPLKQDRRKPRTIIVIDTESRTDPGQGLSFASYRLFDVSWSGEVPMLSCVEEGLVHPDDLERTDPKGYLVLWEYARTHAPAIDPYGETPSVMLHLRSLAGFLKDVFRPLADEARALVVCFNFGFDLSRIAGHWSAVGPRRRRGEQPEEDAEPDKLRSMFAGGFSLSLWGRRTDGRWQDNPARPRLLIKHIDSKRSLKAFGSTAKKYTNPENLVPDERGKLRSFRGHFLDLRTLCFALTDRGHTLESACDAFGVPYTKRAVIHGQITPDYVDYNREDVEATARLFAAAMRDYVRHPIDLQATKAYSPASIGKAYLEAMGVTPPLARLGKIR